MFKEFIIRELNVSEVNEVSSGTESSSDAVAKNTRTAEAVCGKGHVKSVSKDGFECK